MARWICWFVAWAGASAATRVFSAGEGGVACYRIPAVVATSKGTLIAFAEARFEDCGDAAAQCRQRRRKRHARVQAGAPETSAEGRRRVRKQRRAGGGARRTVRFGRLTVVEPASFPLQVHRVRSISAKRSTDGGLTWSTATFVVGNARRRAGNPYPIATAGGDLALVYVERESGAGVGNGTGLVWSKDDGVSWGLGALQDFGLATGSMPGPGAGIESLGRLLVMSHHGAYNIDYITVSDDGLKWQTLNKTFQGMDEAVLADIKGGKLLANFRHRAEASLGRGVSRSFDNGDSWTDIEYDAALRGPVCQASLAAVGGALFFANPASSTKREDLTIRRSDDGGYTWPSSLVVVSGPLQGGYSSLVAAAVGDSEHGGILYEATKGDIDFSTFPLDLHTSPLSSEFS